MPSPVDYTRLVTEVFRTSLGVKSGDRVWVQSWDHSLDLASAFASECASGAYPCLLSVRYEDAWLQSVLRGSKWDLESITPQEKAALEETDFYIFTMGPRSPVPWNSIPDDRRGEVSVWLDTRYDKSAYARKWARIAKANKVRMLAIEATLATQERARAQGLDHEEWRSVMFRGCMPDHRAIARRAERLTAFMSTTSSAHVTTPTGTRLAFDLHHRSVEVSDGISTQEMAEKGRIVFLPAGVIEVSVDEESAEGRIIYGAPVRLGSEIIEGLVLELKEGLITRYSANRGADALKQKLKEGGRNARRLSYFGFGLNPNLRHGFTQDDKVLGELTLGFGDNRSVGGKNSAKNQWWASITGAKVDIDDATLLDRGRLTV